TTAPGWPATGGRGELADDQLVAVCGVARRPDAQPGAGRRGDGDREEPALVGPARTADPARLIFLREPHTERLLPRPWPDLSPEGDEIAAPRRLHQRKAERSER